MCFSVSQGHGLVSSLQSEASPVAHVSTFRGQNGEDRGEAEAEKRWISTAGGAGEEHRRQEGSGASGSAAVPSALRGEGATCVPLFPHLSDGDEDTSQSESGKHKGCLLFSRLELILG